jgi:EpsI family protein
MRINPIQATLVSIAVMATAVFAQVLTPRELMANATSSLDLEKAIPRQFGRWTYEPSVGLVTPTDPEDFVETNTDEKKIYSKELGRGYRDRDGNVVMLLIAYGPVQNSRLKSHLPELCYTAAGFRVSNKSSAEIAYNSDAQALKISRLITNRETRFEPVSYWIRLGNDVATGNLDNSFLRLKYGLRGLVPDGALVRVSIVGLPPDQSFKIQDEFLVDLLRSVDPITRKFLVGQLS